MMQIIEQEMAEEREIGMVVSEPRKKRGVVLWLRPGNQNWRHDDAEPLWWEEEEWCPQG